MPLRIQSLPGICLAYGALAALAASAAPGNPPGPSPRATEGFSLSTLDAGGYMGEWIRAAVGKDGLPFIAYYDFDVKGVKTLHCGDSDCGKDKVFASQDTVGLMGWFISLRIPSDGRPLMTHYDVTREDLRFIRCDEPTCAQGRSVTVLDSAGETGRFNSLALGADGLPFVSFQDVSHADLRMAFCADTACAAGTLLRTVDTAGRTGLHTAAALGPDGFPVVAYQDATHGDVLVLKCADRTCSEGNRITKVDTAGDVGQFLSMVLDSAGRPVLSYADDQGGLRLAHCGDAACATGNRIGTVVSHERVGGSPSMALDPRGNPVISYYAADPRDMKIARCSDPLCAGPRTYHLVDSAGTKGLYSALLFLPDGSTFLAYFDEGHYDLLGARCVGESCWEGSATSLRPRGPGARSAWAPAWRPWKAERNGVVRDLRGRRPERF